MREAKGMRRYGDMYTTISATVEGEKQPERERLMERDIMEAARLITRCEALEYQQEKEKGRREQ